MINSTANEDESRISDGVHPRRRTPPSSLRRFSSTTPPPPTSSSAFDFVSSPAPFIEKQFEDVPIPEILEKAKAQIEELKGPFGRLAEILKECPSQYHRFHSEWSFEMRTAVSLLAFVHLVETGNLLLRAEAEKKLGLDSSEFYVDIEDHLTAKIRNKPNHCWRI